MFLLLFLVIERCIPRYWSGSNTFTQTPHASVTFDFVGTRVIVKGARRWNHGHYSVTLDSIFQAELSGEPENDDEFDTVLYEKDGLEQGTHRIVLTNQEDLYLDIDCVRCFFY